MKKLIEVKERLVMERASLESQLEEVRRNRETLPSTEPYNDRDALLAVAKAKTQDMIDGTTTAEAIRQAFHDKRTAIEASQAKEEKAREKLRKSEERLIVDADMISTQIMQLDKDIEAGIIKAARHIAEVAMQNYQNAIEQAWSAFIEFAAAARLSRNQKVSPSITVELPYPLGSDLPKGMVNQFTKAGYQIRNIETRTTETLNDKIETLKSDILSGAMADNVTEENQDASL